MTPAHDPNDFEVGLRHNLDVIRVISDDGTIIRMAAADINLYSRTAQGVRVMRVDRDTKVIALARVPKENEEEDAAEEANQAGKEP